MSYPQLVILWDMTPLFIHNGAFSYLYRLIRNGQLKETQELLQNVEECCWKAISKSSEN